MMLVRSMAIQVTEFVGFRDESVLGRNFVVEEEYKKSACEDLTCGLKTLYVL
jgi:hypothetical protein